ncbi:MAG TPA: hypothetical protein VNL94_07680 [Candidatus Binatia bacterium]|nr:hypothetical protein [Candidatus Binatia bacterium]
MLLLLLAGFATALAPVALAVPGPGNECEGEAVPSGRDDPCTEDGVGGFDLGFVVPLAGVVAIAGVGILVGGYLVLRRRAAAPLNPDPVDAQDWWTCRNCGRNNVVGSARCYACGSWQR